MKKPKATHVTTDTPLSWRQLSSAFRWFTWLFIILGVATGAFFNRRLFLPVILLGIYSAIQSISSSYLSKSHAKSHTKSRKKSEGSTCAPSFTPTDRGLFGPCKLWWSKIVSLTRPFDADGRLSFSFFGTLLGLLVLVSPAWGYQPWHQLATALRFFMMLGVIAWGIKLIRRLNLEQTAYVLRLFVVATSLIFAVGVVKTALVLFHGESPSSSGFQMSLALLLGLYWPAMFVLRRFFLFPQDHGIAENIKRWTSMPFTSLPSKVLIGYTVCAFMVIALAFLCFFGPMRSTAIAFGLAHLTFFACRRWINFGVIVVVGLFLICGPALIALNASVESSTLLDATRAWLNVSGQHRLVIWWETSQHFLTAPWLGYGTEASRYIGNHVELYTNFIPKLGPEMKIILHRGAEDILPPFHTHNGPLQILLEFGVAGFVVMLFLVITALLKLCRKDFSYASGVLSPQNASLTTASTPPWIMASLVGLMIPFCFNYGLWQMHWIAVQALTCFAWVLVINTRQPMLPQPK